MNKEKVLDAGENVVLYSVHNCICIQKRYVKDKTPTINVYETVNGND